MIITWSANATLNHSIPSNFFLPSDPFISEELGNLPPTWPAHLDGSLDIFREPHMARVAHYTLVEVAGHRRSHCLGAGRHARSCWRGGRSCRLLGEEVNSSFKQPRE